MYIKWIFFSFPKQIGYRKHLSWGLLSAEGSVHATCPLSFPFSRRWCNFKEQGWAKACSCATVSECSRVAASAAPRNPRNLAACSSAILNLLPPALSATIWICSACQSQALTFQTAEEEPTYFILFSSQNSRILGPFPEEDNGSLTKLQLGPSLDPTLQSPNFKNVVLAFSCATSLPIPIPAARPSSPGGLETSPGAELGRWTGRDSPCWWRSAGVRGRPAAAFWTWALARAARRRGRRAGGSAWVRPAAFKPPAAAFAAGWQD